MSIEAEELPLRFFLFRNLRIQLGDNPIEPFEGQKPKELLCYMLLHRQRPFIRDILMTLLWEDGETNRARKNFRQTLWQLQSDLRERLGAPGERLLWVDTEWIGINEKALIWSDVDVLQQAFNRTQGIAGYALEAQQAQALKEAAELYRGDLLEGWYQDWCLFERERLQNIYLMILDKLMDYCEANLYFEDGIVYGMRILKIDYARERTHRRLMRLYYQSGDRTKAIRQYDRCLQVLEKELQVTPSQRTIELNDDIRQDRQAPPARRHPAGNPTHQLPSRARMVEQLNQMGGRLAEANQRMILDIHAMIGLLMEDR